MSVVKSARKFHVHGLIFIIGSKHRIVLMISKIFMFPWSGITRHHAPLFRNPTRKDIVYNNIYQLKSVV